MSTWDAMSESEYADCIDAGRGPVRDVRDEADQLHKMQRENGELIRDALQAGLLDIVAQTAGARPCVLCQTLTFADVHGEPVCGECERQMAEASYDERERMKGML